MNTQYIGQNSPLRKRIDIDPMAGKRSIVCWVMCSIGAISYYFENNVYYFLSPKNNEWSTSSELIYDIKYWLKKPNLSRDIKRDYLRIISRLKIILVFQENLELESIILDKPNPSVLILDPIYFGM